MASCGMDCSEGDRSDCECRHHHDRGRTGSPRRRGRHHRKGRKGVHGAPSGAAFKRGASAGPVKGRFFGWDN